MSTTAEGVHIARSASNNTCVGRGCTTPEDFDVPHHVSTEEYTVGQKATRLLFDKVGILRSSPIRLAILFWLLFATCFGLGLYGFYQTIQDRMASRIDFSISKRFSEIEQIYKTDGVDQVVNFIAIKSSSPMTSSMGYQLSDSSGERIAGNVPLEINQPGWSVLSGEDLGMAGAEEGSRYRFFTSSVDGYMLSMGRSLDGLDETRQIAIYCLWWTMALSTSLAFAVAILLALRLQRRVNYVSCALDKVGAGDLQSRLPVSSRGDDIDILSGKINGSLDQLRLTVDGMRQVSTDIAHDLKTPLNRLFIALEDTAQKSRAGDCVADQLEDALDEAQAINSTFEALLRIAQIEAGAKKSQFKQTDLKELLETATEIYSPVVEENEQTLSVDVRPGADGSTLPVFGDKSLLLQMVVNLIENSVNHCATGTHITVSGGEDEGSTWLRIADTGAGIPEHEREKVFQRLYRLERSRTTAGTGLGLSLVKAIGDLHGGTITLEDNQPGLSFTVRFKRQIECGEC